jgi:uncharacterized protein YgiM (DUF1202 family)
MFRYLSGITITIILALSVMGSAGPTASIAMATKSASSMTRTLPTVTPRITTTNVTSTIITGIDKVTRLRVRESASLRSKVLFLLIRGQSVNILGLSATHSWLKIETMDGKIGWVSVPFMRLVGGKLSKLPVVQ